MRVAAALTFAWLPFAVVVAQPARQRTNSRAEPPQIALPNYDPLNLYRERPGCTPVPQQVAGTERRNGTRLDQQPPGRALLAVDRQVDGCREVTFISDERRRQGR